MTEKTTVDVLIGGKVYTLSGYEGEEYLQKVASYINNKMNELNAVEAFKHFPADMKSILVHLNIADDYFKAKEYIEKLEYEAEMKEKELYDLKHDLVSAQMKAENDETYYEEYVKELEAENKELTRKAEKLEAALSDVKKENQPFRKK